MTDDYDYDDEDDDGDVGDDDGVDDDDDEDDDDGDDNDSDSDDDNDNDDDDNDYDYDYDGLSFIVRSSDKRIAHDGELSDSEDEGDGRKNILSSKEDGPQKKRAKITTPVPKGTGEDKTEKKTDEKPNDEDAEKKPDLKKKENGAEKLLSPENEAKPPPRFVILQLFCQLSHFDSAIAF